MNKCWFVLQQSFYAPPEYESPTRARGKTVGGDLRLGDVVPSPANISIPFSRRGSYLSSASTCASRARDCASSHGALQARGNTAGQWGGVAVVNAELSAEFKQTVKNWKNFGKVDIEVVRPSRGYIEEVLTLPAVKEYIERQKPLFGAVHSLFLLSPNRDVAGVFNAKLHCFHTNSTGNESSVEIKGDRV
ncbi:hypothetical protein F5Y07DRAFT_397593 [Xylaria sp. FL0933]|nr:hypothetical protein F5Y07DRAFT_397593 [Xylaria sp. FL0933]